MAAWHRILRLAGPALLAATLAAHAAEVWTWKDRQGVTHYGDAAAAAGQAGASRVSLGDTGIPESERRAAQARLAKDKAGLETIDVAEPLPLPPPPPPPPAARRAPKADGAAVSCEEAWRRYDESYACFDPYRMAYGRVRPEAYRHCTEVQQPPELCRR